VTSSPPSSGSEGPSASAAGGSTEGSVGETVPEDAGDGRGVLLTVAGGNFAQLGSRLVLSAVVPLVLVRFGASKSSVGLALTGMWVVYALIQFPSGVLADRFGERRLLLGGLVGVGVGAATVALAPSLAAFGVAVLVLGAGGGLFFPAASALVSRLSTSRGGSLGFLTAAGAISGVVYPAVGGTVATRFDWRAAVALGAVAVLPCLLATVLLVPSLPPVRPNRRLGVLVDARYLAEILTRPGVAYTTLLAVLGAFTIQGYSSFFPTFLVEYRGLDTGTAGLAFGVAFALSAVAQPAAGALSDRTSRDLALAASIGLTAVGFLVILAVPGTAGLVAGVALLGVGISWPGVISARIMDQLDASERGLGFGLVRTVFLVLAASGSAVVGALADYGGWGLAFGALVAVLAAYLLLLAANHALGLDL